MRGSLVLLVALAAPAWGQGPDSILKKVDDHYNQLSTLRTRYVETYAGMGMTRTEAGTLTLKKPGRMRWAYDMPPGKLFILDGKYAWSYAPGDAQAVRLPESKLDDLRSPLRFLLGHTQLKKELGGISVAAEGSDFRISGVPKGMEQRVKSLSLLVNASGQIEQMKLVEVDGATTSFSFSDQHENVKTGASEFVFVAPAGVGVVDGASPI